jgi:hypothetical protein
LTIYLIVVAAQAGIPIVVRDLKSVPDDRDPGFRPGDDGKIRR